MRKLNGITVVGTRPESIRLAAVINKLENQVIVHNFKL